jgi:hypothetical protein
VVAGPISGGHTVSNYRLIGSLDATSMDLESVNPFRPHLSRDDYSALERISRDVAMPPHVSQHLVNLGLITQVMGHFILTQKGSMSLATGPIV